MNAELEENSESKNDNESDSSEEEEEENNNNNNALILNIFRNYQKFLMVLYEIIIQLANGFLN